MDAASSQPTYLTDPILMDSQTSAKSRTAKARPKRVRQACEECRVKKTKCDGQDPCSRCLLLGIPCDKRLRPEMTRHLRPSPKGYIEMLEKHISILETGVQALYRAFLARQGLSMGGCGFTTQDILSIVCDDGKGDEEVLAFSTTLEWDPPASQPGDLSHDISSLLYDS